MRRARVVDEPRVVADLAHDGTTWVATWMRDDRSTYVAHVIVARGEDLAAGHSVASAPYSASSSYLGFYAPRLAVTGDVVELVYAKREATDGSSRLLFRRFRLPAGTAAPTPLTDAIELLTTATSEPRRGYDLLRTGAQAFAAWSDTRWGDRELYVTPVDLRSCP